MPVKPQPNKNTAVGTNDPVPAAGEEQEQEAGTEDLTTVTEALAEMPDVGFVVTNVGAQPLELFSVGHGHDGIMMEKTVVTLKTGETFANHSHYDLLRIKVAKTEG